MSLSSPTAGPGSTFQLTVKNTGQSQDIFDLQLGGPAGLAATLSISEITLSAGQSQTIPITVEAIPFAFAGDLELTVVATSRANTAVKDSDTALVRIGVNKGLSVTLGVTFVYASTVGLPMPCRCLGWYHRERDGKMAPGSLTVFALWQMARSLRSLYGETG